MVLQEASKHIVLATDVAHIVLFHPDDLAHAEYWPIAWYAETFIYPVESAAKRLIAWSTGADGVFKLRLTTGGLTEREVEFSGPSFVFPFRVRHGSVFVDNSDGLPGVEKMIDPSASPDHWFELANGDYAVTVTAVEWEAEPGARDEGHETLPNYVVAFAPLAGRSINLARRPPDLIGSRDATVRDEPFVSGPHSPQPVDLGRLYPAFAAADVAPVGRSFESRGEAPVEAAVPAAGDDFAIFDLSYVIAADLVPGAPAVVASCHGVRGRPEDEKVFSFKSEHVVEIAEVEGYCRNGEFFKPERHWIFRRREEPLPTDALATVRIRPLEFREDGPMRVDVDAFRAEILVDLNDQGVLGRHLAGVAGYEALRLAAADDAGVLADWLLDHLPLSGRDRLGISLLPINDRFTALERAYRRFCGDI